MAKIEMIECGYDVIQKIPNVMDMLYELFGDGTIMLYAVLVDKQLSFVGRSGNRCALVQNGSYTLFELENESLLKIVKDNYEVYVNDNYFVSKDGMEHWLEFFEMEEDLEEYNGRISYKQYNPVNDTFCIIAYQQMYNDRDGKPLIYQCHTEVIDGVYIDEKIKEIGRPVSGFIPNTSKYFNKLEVNDDMFGYKIAALKEFGLFKCLEKGALALYKEPKVIRYIDVSYIDSKGNYIEFWPLGKQIDSEAIVKLIEDYGFNSSIPNLFIDVYNNWDETVNLIRGIVEKMKPFTEDCLKNPLTTKCAKLTLRQ